MTATKIHKATDYILFPSLVKCARDGYWFCDHCCRVIPMDCDNDSPCKCPRCKKLTVQWRPPVL